MLIEELLHESPPVHTDRLRAQQDRERADRNAETLLAWHVACFGEVVGRRLFEESQRG